MGKRRWLLLSAAVLALAAAGWAVWYYLIRDPDYVEILSVTREPSAPIPATTRMRNEGPLMPVALTVRRADLAILARHDATFELLMSRCDRDWGRVYYGSELYLDGAPIRQFNHDGPMENHVAGRAAALLQREAAATSKGDRAIIVAIMPRKYALGGDQDVGDAPCMKLVTREDAGGDSAGAIRMPPTPNPPEPLG